MHNLQTGSVWRPVDFTSNADQYLSAKDHREEVSGWVQEEGTLSQANLGQAKTGSEQT